MQSKKSIDHLMQQVLNPKSASYNLTKLSDAVEAVFEDYGTEDISTIIEMLVREKKITVEEGSNILRVAIWSGCENGSNLLRSLDEWLREGSDAIRVSLAINQEVYPFIDRNEMYSVLTKIAKEFPVHAMRCQSLIESRP
jgi:hypothetical protein